MNIRLLFHDFYNTLILWSDRGNPYIFLKLVGGTLCRYMCWIMWNFIQLIEIWIFAFYQIYAGTDEAYLGVLVPIVCSTGRAHATGVKLHAPNCTAECNLPVQIWTWSISQKLDLANPFTSWIRKPVSKTESSLYSLDSPTIYDQESGSQNFYWLIDLFCLDVSIFRADLGLLPVSAVESAVSESPTIYCRAAAAVGKFDTPTTLSISFTVARKSFDAGVARACRLCRNYAKTPSIGLFFMLLLLCVLRLIYAGYR